MFLTSTKKHMSPRAGRFPWCRHRGNRHHLTPSYRWWWPGGGTPDGLGPLGRGHPCACLLPGSAAVVVPVGGWEVVLAVDEDVVGGVGDGDGGGGLRVAGAG